MNETLYSSDLVSLQIRANESNTRKIVRSILWRYAPSSAKTVCNAMKRLSKLVPSFTGYIYLVLSKEYSILGSGRTNVLLGWTYLFNRDFRDLSVILGSFFFYPPFRLQGILAHQRFSPRMLSSNWRIFNQVRARKIYRVLLSEIFKRTPIGGGPTWEMLEMLRRESRVISTLHVASFFISPTQRRSSVKGKRNFTELDWFLSSLW